MKKGITFFVLILVSWNLYAPPNCEIYKGNDNCYKSCKEAMKAIRYKQGSYDSQQHFEKSIDLCPSLAYSYMEKAVPYLKRGLFIEWKKMIDKAVELSPEEYLGYRGWCRLQFLADYEGAIRDIEKLKALINYDISYCQNGEYHLNIALALCYKEMGEIDKAKKLIIQQLTSENYSVGPYDYYHLGIIEYEEENYENAINYFERQILENDYLAGTYYFKAMAHKNLNQIDLYIKNLTKAESFYRNGKVRFDNYTETIDKIYLIDILKEKNTAANKL
jgi:tetratricopeptide (TPR) repeat protein